MKFTTLILAALSTLDPFISATSNPQPNEYDTPTLEANYTSPLNVSIFNPSSSFFPTGPWSLMSRAGPTLYIAGMRGVAPEDDSLVQIGYPRVRQAFENMRYLANIAGTDLVLSSKPPR